jgi:hypothetical protein
MKTKCLFTLTLTGILVVVVFTAFAEEPKVADQDIYIPTTVAQQAQQALQATNKQSGGMK